MYAAGDSQLQASILFVILVIFGSYVMHPVAFSSSQAVQSPEGLASTHRAMVSSVAIPNRRDDHGDLASGIFGL